MSEQKNPPRISDIMAPAGKVAGQVIKLEPKEEKKEDILSARNILDGETSDSEKFSQNESKKSPRDLKKRELDFLKKFKTAISGPADFFSVKKISGGLKKTKKLIPARKKSWIIIILTAGFFGLFLAFYFILPTAEVKITPKSENLSFDLRVLAEKDATAVDLKNARIPAQVFTTTKNISQIFKSSGKKLKESKAEGAITVYNSYSSSPQTLVKGTRFMSENGRIFKTIDTVTIPGATIEDGRINASAFEVKVMADEPGQDYNIDTATFSIPGFQGTPKYTAFYGKSKEKMREGFRGQVDAVTQEDLDAALKKVTSLAKESAESDLGKKIPANLQLINDAQETKIGDIKSPDSGNEQSEFQVNVQAVSRAIVFSQDQLKKILNQKIKDMAAKDRNVAANSQQVIYLLNKFPDFDKGILDFKATVKFISFWNINEELFKNNLAGKNEQGIKDFLSGNDAVRQANVTLWPFWVKKAPRNLEKIKINVIMPEN